MKYTKLAIFSLSLILLFPDIAFADPINFIAVKSEFNINGQQIDFTSSIPYELSYPSEDNGMRLRFVTDYFDSNLSVQYKYAVCRVVVESINIAQSSNVFKGKYICNEPVDNIEDIKITSTIFLDLFADVNHFIVLRGQGTDATILLTRQNKVFSGVLLKGAAGEAEESFWGRLFEVIRQFVGLGIPHILFGFDHVLFLLAIHSVVRKPRDILIVITSFTIAHSLTLILAGMGIVTITARIVEPLIALSIAYSAVRNIFILLNNKTEEEILKERWVSTFGFGLVHGLGFAGALTDIKIPQAYFVPALLSFNAGVEIGQVIVVAAFISFLALIKRWGWLTETIYALSVTIALISSIWVVERIF